MPQRTVWIRDDDMDLWMSTDRATLVRRALEDLRRRTDAKIEGPKVGDVYKGDTARTLTKIETIKPLDVNPKAHSYTP